ncbi:SDR family oxidoreductase [Streptomyces pactum]|uniref:SDR family oxidoreductase n=1 Tax=Streptomyces pactum TaxID=68249 RepID=A0ABS0NL44_9ACTN|nr:UDP-glucuronic acid decarboxylase family protein [Streptomyces pactum]MBH5335916.1 SDR family oxidoreductase [Streptomyces pactum]
MARTVVTGGAGFVGSHLCDRLMADGHHVVCVDNFITGSVDNVAHLAGSGRFELVEADVSQGLAVDGPVDAVLHFASPASPVDYQKFPVETLKVGSFGTFNALELAKDKGARFLLASTSEVYGTALVHPQPESYWGNVNPVGPRSCYDEAKRFGEAATATYRERFGVDTGIVRIFNTFGPRMRTDDGRAIPNFIGQALRGEDITVSGDGTQTRSICYVDDLVEGIVRLLDSGLPGPVNIGNPYEISMLDLARWIQKLTGTDAELVHVPRPQDDPEVRRPDISYAERELGWTPRAPVEQALDDTITWYRDRLTAATPSGEGGVPDGSHR